MREVDHALARAYARRGAAEPAGVPPAHHLSPRADEPSEMNSARSLAALAGVTASVAASAPAAHATRRMWVRFNFILWPLPVLAATFHTNDLNRR